MRPFFSEKGPKPMGPYSQAIISGGFIFLSGQLPIDPEKGVVCGPPIQRQTERVFNNIKAILEDAGSDLNRVVMVFVALSNLSEYKGMNEVYQRFFPENPPARFIFEASRLPKDVKIEVSVIPEVSEQEGPLG